jgi:hypothetical protein
MSCRSRCKLFHLNGIMAAPVPLSRAAGSPMIRASPGAARSPSVRCGLTLSGTNAGEFGLLSTATEEDFMRIKLLVAAAGLVAFATPSLAAEFYIVQDSTTKRCTIVEQKPTTQTTTVVGPMTYTTRTEAESAMKTVKVCESGGTVGGPVPPPPPGR